MGRPIFAVDLGGGRAWSACVAIWQSGLVDAVAIAPGIPDLRDQEKARRRSKLACTRNLPIRGRLRWRMACEYSRRAMLMDFATVSELGRTGVYSLR